MSPDGELQWHQFDGLNPMGSIAHLATELVPDLRAPASYSWWVYKGNRNALRSFNAILTRRWTTSLELDDYRPRAICCANRYEVMGLELGVVEEGAQAGRQTFKKFREAGSARKWHSLFEDEYRAHKPVMVKFRCPTCAAGGLGTKDAKMHHMCERGVNEGSARRRGLGSSLERKWPNCFACSSCAWAYISEAWRLVKVHDYGVHRDGLGVRALAEVSCPEESVNLQLVPGNKLACMAEWAGLADRHCLLVTLHQLQVPTEAILEKTLGTNASLAKTFIKDTKKTIKHLNKLAAERYTDNDSDEDGPMRHHYFPMLQK
ncbi:BQ5605_C075g12915 [Microbotryum silenes-dioicae]|uniref:BQ5605_C075g12915 protein n=1 Tax=Microbotryum silenes-dioicae TaxID=796604 RepID=A0A2X0PPP4_9BASI|nr:BQ5605_C075g12915 [Microbotryum silenes-dioicae]